MYTEDLLQENFQTTAQNKKPLIVKKTKQKTKQTIYVPRGYVARDFSDNSKE